MAHYIAVCPNLKGNAEGVRCSIANDFIKNIKDTDIKVCMSRHYESCPLYFCGLKALAEKSRTPDIRLELRLI